MASSTSRPWCRIATILILLLSLCVVASHGARDTELLLNFKGKLQNTDALSSWNNSTTPCSDSKKSKWKGITCYDGKVWGLTLENMGLKGEIDVESLKGLPYLRIISLRNNEFEGGLPKFGSLLGLKGLFLSNNKFSGEIPDNAFEGMQWLKKVYLDNNKFQGPIPCSLAMLPKLIELRLNGNQFSGEIPLFRQGNIHKFDFSNNKLQGQIPVTLSKTGAGFFKGNEGLCGAPLAECPKRISVASIVVVSIVVSLALIVILAVAFILHRRRNQRDLANTVEDPASSSSLHSLKGRVKDLGSESKRSTRSQSSNHSRRGDHMKLSFIRDDRERFDLQDLLKASAEILGSGCFSSSYKASVSHGNTIVVKRFKQMNNVGKEEFQEHMRRLGRLNNPNLHPLVAYYYRKEEKLLVTDFVKNGSLAVRLHGHQALGEPSLDWPTRLKIVKGIAKGLEYLYKDMPSLIAPHGNLKSSNVLLSETFEPLLCDYGLVPVINQDLAQDIMVIYKSPEYLHHGRTTKKSDVWCLGILIIEIITGKFPANFLQQGKGSEVSLANWVLSVVPEDWTREVFDKEMGETKNSEGEMVKLLRIALGCCEGDVEKRWDLKEAVQKILEIKERDQDDEFFSSAASDADARSSRGLSSDFT